MVDFAGWTWIDSRNRVRVSDKTCNSREQAEQEMADWHVNVNALTNAMLIELMRFVVVVRVPAGLEGTGEGFVFPETGPA